MNLNINLSKNISNLTRLTEKVDYISKIPKLGGFDTIFPS